MHFCASITNDIRVMLYFFQQACTVLLVMFSFRKPRSLFTFLLVWYGREYYAKLIIRPAGYISSTPFEELTSDEIREYVQIAMREIDDRL